MTMMIIIRPTTTINIITIIIAAAAAREAAASCACSKTAIIRTYTSYLSVNELFCIAFSTIWRLWYSLTKHEKREMQWDPCRTHASSLQQAFWKRKRYGKSLNAATWRPTAAALQSIAQRRYGQLSWSWGNASCGTSIIQLISGTAGSQMTSLRVLEMLILLCFFFQIMSSIQAHNSKFLRSTKNRAVSYKRRHFFVNHLWRNSY